MDTSSTALTRATASPRAQAELRGWCFAAVAALAVSGLFAIVAFASRVPAVTDALPFLLDFFSRGLVIHVIYSFVIWFLFCLGALAVAFTHLVAAHGGQPVSGPWGRASLALAIIAALLMLVPSFDAGADPSLNNYVPALGSPLFYGALALLLAALLAVLYRYSLALFRTASAVVLSGASAAEEKALLRNPAGLTFAAGFAFTLAVIAFAVAALLAWPDIDGVETVPNEDLFWGGGHLLQVTNVALLSVAWCAMASLRLGRSAPSPGLFAPAIVFLLGAAAAGLAPYVLFDAFSAAQTQAFTTLQFLLGPVPLALGGAIAATLLRQRGDGPALAAHIFWLSFALFLVGGVLGLFVDGTDARTPGHYHGVIGAVTLALMGLFFTHLLPMAGRAVRHGKWVFGLVWFYAVGQAMHALGLFIKGGYGAPRKTAGHIEGLEGAGVEIGQLLFRTGAPLAILAGAAFVIIAGRALLKRPPQNPH